MNYSPDPTGYARMLWEQNDYARVKALATRLHTKFCTLSHIDACTWDYEGNDWTQWAHRRYYTRAMALKDLGLPEDAIFEVLEILKVRLL